MENTKTEGLDVKKTILLIGAVMGSIIAFAVCGSILSIFGGLIGGLIFAGFFNSVIIPAKESDR